MYNTNVLIVKQLQSLCSVLSSASVTGTRCGQLDLWSSEEQARKVSSRDASEAAFQLVETYLDDFWRTILALFFYDYLKAVVWSTPLLLTKEITEQIVKIAQTLWSAGPHHSSVEHCAGWDGTIQILLSVCLGPCDHCSLHCQLSTSQPCRHAYPTCLCGKSHCSAGWVSTTK